MKKQKLRKLILGMTVIAAVVVGAMVFTSCAAPTAPGPGPAPTPEPGEPTPTPAPEPAEEQPVYKWRLTTVWVADLTDLQLRPAMERLEEVSGGRIEVEIFLADELVTQDEVIPAVQDGTIDITHNVMQLINAPIDLVDLMGCPPFTTDNGPELDVLFEERGLNELIEEAWEEVDGITWLDSGSYDPTNLITTEPITKYEDLDGLKLHGPVGIYNVLKNAGVVMTTVPWEEIYMSSQTGILDGIAWCGATEGFSCSWYETMPYFLTNPVCGAWECSWLVNDDSWNELPPDLQEMWLMAIDAWNYKRTKWYFAGESHHRTQPLFTLTSMSPEDWAKVLAGKEAEYDRIAAISPRCAEAIRIVRDYQAELEAAGPPYRYK